MEDKEKSADTKKFEERKDKIKTWFKNPENLILIAILVFAFLIRVYYFSLTINQPLWWDEGEYGLKAKSLAFGTPSTGWYGAREIVVPFLFSLILRMGGSEAIFRFVQFLVSFATIIMVYVLGRQMFNKRIALIATAIISVNAVHLFFTGRVLTYLWAPLFFLLTFSLFFQGYVQKKGKKYLYSAPIVAALGLATYGSLAFGIAAIVLFLIISERHHFLKRKEIWIMALIGFISLIPQFAYSKIAYGSFASRWTALQSSHPAPDFSFIFGYFNLFPHLFGWIFTIAIAFGLIYILIILIFSYDLVLKNQTLVLKSYLLIVLWAIFVFGFYTYVAVGWWVVYDAFVLSAFPAFALIGAVGINFIYELKFNKKILLILVIALVLVGSFYQVRYANSIITSKLTSFDSVKYSGEWIKQNSNPDDIVISSSLPQMTYYSERTTYPYTRSSAVPDDPTIRTTEEDFEKFVNEKKPRFITDSIWEQVPAWVHQYATIHNDTMVPVQVYFLDAQKTQPSLIIYEVKY